MKKNIYLFLMSLTFIAFTGCEESLDAKITDIDYISFQKESVDLNVNKGSSNSVTYDVYSSKKSSSERTYAIVVDEALTTADPASYTVPASITIPANSNKGSFEVSVEDINVIDSRDLVLRFKDENNIVAGDQMKVKIVRICDFDITNFYGTYDALEDGEWEYEVVASAGPAEGTLLLTNVYEAGGETVVGIDGSSSNVTIRSIEFDAILYVHSTYGNLYANTLSDTPASSYGACDNSINLNFMRTVSAGNFTTNINVVLTKK